MKKLRLYKELFLLVCLTLLLVKCCNGTKERHQRRKITLAEFLYQRLHRLGIKKNRRRQNLVQIAFNCSEFKMIFQAPLRKITPSDRINHLLHYRNSDPNLLLLQNYFRKIKSTPETSEARHEPTATEEESPKKLNVFAGFGPILRSESNKNKPKKSSQEKKRPGRKIFLTVDEAFSDSDFGHFGREMQERDTNYLIYVPVPRQLPDHNIRSPQQVCTHVWVKVKKRK